MSLATRIADLRTSSFLRSVGVLTGGIVLAHGVTAAAMPIATRLYSPADFTLLAPFAGLLSIIGTAACLRFDTAVPMPEDDGDGANLLALALLSCAAVSLLLAITLAALPGAVTGLFDQPALRTYAWLLPLAVLLFGSFAALQSWFVRRKDFLLISRARVGQSFAGAGVQLGFGWLGISPLGLMLGQVLTTCGGGLLLAGRAVSGREPALSAVSAARMRRLFRLYRRFPTYSTLESLCNTGGMQIPMIMIAGMAAGPEAGYLILAMYIMQAPMGLIGTSVNQVFVSRAPDEHRAGRLARFTVSVYSGLLRSGAGPLIFAGIVAPTVFSLIFGAEWRRAGVLVSWLTPWFVLQFLVVPISLALHVTNHLRSALAMQGLGLVIRVAAVAAAAQFAAPRAAEAYALSGMVVYLLYLILVLRTVGARAADVARTTFEAFPIVAAWALGGILVDAGVTFFHAAIAS